MSINRLLLAGNFGKKVQQRDIADIGIIPLLSAESVDICGNTSLKGAIGAATGPTTPARVESLLEKLECVELNAQRGLQDEFLHALFIPHLKIEFPETTPVSS